MNSKDSDSDGSCDAEFQQITKRFVLTSCWLMLLTFCVVMNTRELESRQEMILESRLAVEELLRDNIDLRRQLRERGVLTPPEK